MESYIPLRNILYQKRDIEMASWEKEEQKMIAWCSRAKIATSLSNWWIIMWQMPIIDISKAFLESLYVIFGLFKL